ncbi:hypothetical protein [Kineococcus sp. SYSU DK004]|uniref:hypothetical protein n=1 Tax=Kineococcus sp. SYSU DK004 TaxID=3383125 RepID=UPI003D7D1D2E
MISLKFALLRNSSPGLRKAGWVLGAVLVVATWAAAATAADDAVRRSVLALALALWALGAVLGPVLMSGAGVLRPEHFALLPLSRAAVGRGLLVSAFVGTASGYVLLALLAPTWHAVLLDPATVAVAVVGAVLSWVFVISLSRLTYGLLGAAMRTRLGIEIAGVQFGIMFAAMFAGWMLVSVATRNVSVLLRRGLPEGPVTTALEVFPTSWPLRAVEAAAAGGWGRAAALLLALLVLDAVVVGATVALLVPRSVRTARRRGRPRSASLVAGAGLLPATRTGAVVLKEVRQWRRDPWRALESSTAVWTGVVIGVLALLSVDFAPVAAFSGLIVAFMLALSGCNVYGQDGSAVWLDVVGEDETSVRSDVRGRQWAMVLVFLPRVLVVTVLFLFASGAWWAVPYLLATTAATLGAAAGAAVLTSAVGVSPGVDPRRRTGPNDANGNIALHVWVAILATVLGVLPTAAVVVATARTGSPVLAVLMTVVGVLNGLGAAWLLGAVAAGYLRTRTVDVFSRIRYGRVFHEEAGGGVLDWIARTTLKGEQDMAAAKQEQREDRLQRAGRR